MAELSSIARPYAQAVFELAKDSGQYGPWSEVLKFLAMVAADKDMVALFSNPRVSRQQAADIVIDLFGEAVGDEPKHLVRLLAQNRRLLALSAIAEQYEILRAEAERTIRAELETALSISDGEQHRIAEALKTRLGREVELVVTTNRELVGGAVIRAGDLVIDGSIRARLERLAAAVSA